MINFNPGDFVQKIYKNAYEEYKTKQTYEMNKLKKTYPSPRSAQKVIEETINEQAVEDADFDSLFTEAMEAYKLGVNGDATAVKRSIEQLKRLYNSQPQNYLVEAYYGCATSLLGRDLINPNDRFKYAMKGLKLLDHAVSSEPDNFEIRNLRAYVCFKLPEMYFHRTKTAIEDFNYMISKHEKDNESIPQELYRQILKDLVTAYKTLNLTQEADAIRKKIRQIEQDSINLDLENNSDTDINGREESITEEQKEAQKDMTTPKKKSLERAIEYHARAFMGDKEACKKAYEIFEQAYNEDSDNSILASYYADSLSLLARNSNDSAVLFGSAIKAIKLLDEAVNNNPDNITIRLLRGNHSYRLPESFFRRTATAIKDFDFIVRQYEAGNTKVSPKMYLMNLYLLGKSYKRLNMTDEAKAAWQKLLDLDKFLEFKTLVSKEMDEPEAEGSSSVEIDNMSRNERFEEGKRLHYAVMNGDKRTTKKALELLQKLYEEKPDDPAVEGYYGSILGLSAKDSLESQELFGSAIKGLKLINHAVECDPENINIRYLRSYFYYNLPEAFFHTTNKAIDDFKYLILAYEKDKDLFTEACYWQLLYDLGICHDRLGNDEEANITWNRLLDLSTDPQYKVLLENKLNRS